MSDARAGSDLHARREELVRGSTIGYHAFRLDQHLMSTAKGLAAGGEFAQAPTDGPVDASPSVPSSSRGIRDAAAAAADETQDAFFHDQSNPPGECVGLIHVRAHQHVRSPLSSAPPPSLRAFWRAYTKIKLEHTHTRMYANRTGSALARRSFWVHLRDGYGVLQGHSTEGAAAHFLKVKK